MEVAKLFLITYFAALLGVIPPGLVNMTVAKTCVERGKKSGMYVAMGASFVVFLQAFVAVLLANYIFSNPFVQNILLRAGLVIFIILGIYFFVKAKREEGIEHKSETAKSNSIFKGMLIAVLNVFPIPYFVAIAGALNVGVEEFYPWLKILCFTLAATLGTFTSLYLYVVFFNKIEGKTESFSQFSNYFMALLMLVLIVITLFRIYNT
ncbi:LysE family translocator [Autumnicola psychrophila]|uniref:LysE family transporter n=1 Tax=Autumnicola psychrophila TaxID=3075592 RepID=A0ABU3DN80_9FLAO|nr:LysE family transporter [Zunongwangia sp. F225]MDT0685166.1 LysE family transporter [Zunongwangia sp. F225]